MLIYKIESYCFKCKKYTKNIDPKVSSTSNVKKKKQKEEAKGL